MCSTARPRLCLQCRECGTAVAAILHEAGGRVLDPRSNPLGAFTNLRHRTTLVAGTTKLAMEIVDALTGSGA